MKPSQHRSLGRRWLAFSALLSFLLLCGLSASHIHNAPTKGGVRQECQLCVTGGVPLTLTAGVQVSAALLFTLFLSSLGETQPRAARLYSSSSPRSPPALS